MPSSSWKVMGLGLSLPSMKARVYVCRVVSLVVTNSLPLSVSASTANDLGSRQKFIIRELAVIGTSEPWLSTVGQRFARPEPLTCAYVSWLNCSAVMALAGAGPRMPTARPSVTPKPRRGAAQLQEPCEACACPDASTGSAGCRKKPLLLSVTCVSSARGAGPWTKAAEGTNRAAAASPRICGMLEAGSLQKLSKKKRHTPWCL
mmetsp:Transcript_6143/g.18946  ORF Transcript_6143/g.18946 Transcript_6143/m.18946 type:complete len:204 (-) Transcript_6143:32-643(-)